jgi:hypothetical protein
MLRFSKFRCAQVPIQKIANQKTPKDLQPPKPKVAVLMTTLPFFARFIFCFGIGFAIGAMLEVFVCKTHLYEAVMAKKEDRRHELDEFTVSMRTNMLKWQEEDQERARMKSRAATES